VQNLKKAIKRALDICHLEVKTDKLRIIKAAVFVFLFFGTMILNTQIFFGPIESGETQVYTLRLFCYILLVVGGASLFFAEFRMSQFIRRTISIIGVIVFMVLLTYLNEWINGGDLIGKAVIPLRWIANIICCLMIFTILMTIARRFHVAAALTAVLVLGFGIANYYVTLFRGVPILPWDYRSLGTAAAVSEGYKIILTNEIFQSVTFIFIFIRLLSMVKPDYKTESIKENIIERATAAVMAAVLFIAIIPFDALTSLDINIFAWNQLRSAQVTGVTAGFFGNLQFVLVEKPESYSEEKIAALKAEIETFEEPAKLGYPGKKPTVIAVMNESFADLQKMAGDNFKFSEDNMPYIRELMQSDNVISGEAYSSVLGGSTCDSEYEFLSGNSMLFFPVGSKPYQQYVDVEQTTLVSSLKSQGYNPVVVHPGTESAWNRDKVYPLFGFEKYVYRETFDFKREIVRSHTSDKSCYEQVILEYENKKNSENPQFIFNITIQNHGDFYVKDFESTIFVETKKKYSSVEQYMSLIKRSDEDLKVLIDYFEKEEEPVVILFFGDHWPTLRADFMSKALGAESMDNLTKEQIMQRQQIPYFIWANYPLEKNSELQKKVGINQLAPLLMRAAGLELTPYQKYLTNMSRYLPVVTSVGMIDAAGKHYLPEEKSPYTDMLKDYSILQYNNVFDENDKIYELFEP